jgi:2-oxoglutarate ferredoxin oxidoreductase subunit alpha
MPNLGDGHKLLITGSTHDEFGWRQVRDGEVHRRLVSRLAQKILSNKDKIIQLESNKPKNSTVGIISYGSASRVVNEAISRLAPGDQNKVANLRLISLWPFADEQIKTFVTGLKHIIVPEYNFGLLAREIERFKYLGIEVHKISRIGGGEPIMPKQILDELGVYL